MHVWYPRACSHSLGSRTLTSGPFPTVSPRVSPYAPLFLFLTPLGPQRCFLTQRSSPLYRQNYEINWQYVDFANKSKATLVVWDEQEVICGAQYGRTLINTKKALKQCWLCVSMCPRLWEYICGQDREDSCHHGAFILLGETGNKQTGRKYNTF